MTIACNYKSSGVNIHAGNMLVERLKKIVTETNRPEVIGGLGGFGALCALPQKYREPILVACTDGVGTKLRLAIDLKRNDTIGLDLVAMCVNDLIVQGAEPLFFLDYYATGQLDIDNAASVIKSIIAGCKQSGCALIGGETAEMPGIYNQEDYDLVGFCVGVVEKNKIIDGSKVKAGDAILALGSSGPHANGYSLIRQIIQIGKIDIESHILEHKSLADHLLAPTLIYVKTILSLMKQLDIHAIANITGGSFSYNIPRVLPPNTQAEIDSTSWQWPAIFSWLQQHGNVTTDEMYSTFNCGVGMIIIVPDQNAYDALKILHQSGAQSWKIGQIVAIPPNKPQLKIIT